MVSITVDSMLLTPAIADFFLCVFSGLVLFACLDPQCNLEKAW